MINEKEYMKDVHGHLVPIESIKEIDLLRDQLVNDLVKKTRVLNSEMKNFKESVMDDITAFCELSAEKYGVKIGGKKGNIQLLSFDGKYRVMVAINEYIVFDERLQTAKALIDECITEWVKGSNINVIALINNAFEVDKQGKISTERILGLRRLKIEDEKWTKAMEAISDSITVASTKSYIRIYERGSDEKYAQIPLDLSAV